MRNSLRLFGLLTFLAGVNVYVFFFNQGTAPREVLKPSSMVRGGGASAGGTGSADTLKQASQEARAALFPLPQVIPPAGAATPQKPKPPVMLTPVLRKTGVATNGGPPKGSPGGSPGQDIEWAPLRFTDLLAPSNSPADNPESSPEKKFGSSDTLGQVLAREGLGAESGRVVAALSRLFDPKLIRGGQSYTVRVNEAGEPQSFEYRPNAVTRFTATRGDTGLWSASRVDQPLETRIVTAVGAVESSLYESVQAAGEGSALAGMLVELLAWDINFYTDTRPGDQWKVIVEKHFLGGQFYRYGHILGAEYSGRTGTFRLFYWKPERSNAEGRYFDEKGQAISKSMLRTPLRYVRVSSKFDRHRFHPILHREKAHLGIDYAAPVGTPVWASSGGKVVECAMKRGSGNTVVIGHGNGMTTRYYHLSRFARGLKPGKMVRQKEVIGFVGTTGLSTGPHLHFSVTKNGVFVDPSKVQVSREAPVSDRNGFLAAVRPRIAILAALKPGALARN